MNYENNPISAALEEKFRDINTPGFVATLTPVEADLVFFEEDAIGDDDALEAAYGIIDGDTAE